MVLPISATVPEIMNLGKLYPWPRPERCPRCDGRRLWGHGYVARYFDGYPRPAWIKRWRCADCGAVHTCRPATYWRRFLAPITVILASIATKLAGLGWSKTESRQRQRYWFRGYLTQSRYHGSPPWTLDALWVAMVVVATHSTADRTMLPMWEPPYRRLSSTAPP